MRFPVICEHWHSACRLEAKYAVVLETRDSSHFSELLENKLQPEVAQFVKDGFACNPKREKKKKLM